MSEREVEEKLIKKLGSAERSTYISNGKVHYDLRGFTKLAREVSEIIDAEMRDHSARDSLSSRK